MKDWTKAEWLDFLKDQLCSWSEDDVSDKNLDELCLLLQGVSRDELIAMQ